MKEQSKNSYPNLIRTFNKMGYMFEDITEYEEDFIQFSKLSNGPVLEIAAAFGVVTLKVAKKKINIVANDLEPEHLNILEKKANASQKKFITTLPGRFPQEISFSPNSFTAILASNIFHYLKGEEIIEGIKKISSWLKPKGKVYIVAGTPYTYHWQEFIPILKKNIQEQKPWPGYIDELSMFKHNKRFNDLPSFMHFFTPDILSSWFEKFGFLIAKKGYAARPTWPQDMQLDGRESAGLIAVKK